MKHSSLTKLIASLLLAIVTTTPLYAVCEIENCGPVGPGLSCYQLLYDTGFDQSCSYWAKSNASIVHTQYDSYAKFSGTANGWMSQEVFVPTGQSHHTITLNVDVVTGSPSDTGKLYVEIREPGGQLLETVTILTATSSDGLYDIDIDDYGSFYVKLYFRYKPGTSAGSTEFRVSHAMYFCRNY